MDEERAYEIALRIRDEFEDLLDEKNITIPSADREGVPGEARMYGEENSRLVEAIVELLVEYADGITLKGEIAEPCHPMRELAILACEEFEDLLDDKNIMIPSVDREGREEETCLYGSEYYALEDAVVDILMEELGEDARTAVAMMQKAMAATLEGAATVGSIHSVVQDVPTEPKASCGLAASSR